MIKSIYILLFTSSFLFSQQKKAPFPEVINADEAFILQKETKKPIVFFFYTNWCRYCFAMKDNTFTNEKVIDLLNDNFHFVMFDAESKAPVKIKRKVFKNTSGVHELAVRLAAKNGYMSYPSFVILNNKSRIDEQVNSFLSANETERLLSLYLKKKN